MSEMATVAAVPATLSPDGTPREVFKPGGVRTTILSFVFLLLLPFYVSLPAMMWMRVRHDQWDDAAGLVLTAVAFTIVIGLVFIELVYSLRARVELGGSSVRFTLPAGRGPTPMLRYASAEVPYADIERIETRREIYGSALVPVMLKGARIVTRDGRMHRLGYVTEMDQDAALPYSVIAEHIAARAGQKVVDRGSVRRTVRQKMLGIKALDDPNAPIDAALVEDLNLRHRYLMRVLVGCLVAMILAGIAIDLLDERNGWVSLAPSIEHSRAEKRAPERPEKSAPVKPPAKQPH